ncbi:MAG TPA: hypothetical protein VFK79_03055 [Xanthobacteraceae bacterium]|nr:hypothetical protein [Xanthobacteraceae bacterium]
MSRSRIRLATCALLAATALAGCSDLYFDRRESIQLSAGDALYSNQVTHMVDPWPPQSANRNIGFDGQKMQSAVERYRTNKVIAPVNPTTSTAPYQAAAPAAAPKP